jgi:small conductance mechanosensitive channel
MTDFFAGMPLVSRTLMILGVVVLLHLAVHLVRVLGERLTRSEATASVRKLRTVISLGTSVAVFTFYFVAVGFILRELGISMTAYLASASVIGLAVGFGSQGVVQDVVTGLTLIFSNLVDIGEMVSIGGQTGVVRSIGMRFIVLESSFGALVSIPNRTITNVVSYPRGYVRLIVDVMGRAFRGRETGAPRALTEPAAPLNRRGSTQSVFRYSITARRSASLSTSPKVCPPLP